ncbi:MAG: hypothetical protein ABW139_20180 [Candidatus Thiodiazotropha sp. DIVDIV]
MAFRGETSMVRQGHTLQRIGGQGAALPHRIVILSVGITAAVAMEKGDCLNVRYQGLGSVGMRFV